MQILFQRDGGVERAAVLRVDFAGAFEDRGGGIASVGGFGGQSVCPLDRVRVGSRLDTRGGGHLRGQKIDRFLLFGKEFAARAAAVAEPLLDIPEAGRVEQSLEQLAALVAARAQELRELTLRQQHHLEELFGAHPQQALDGVTDVGDPGQVLALPVEPGQCRLGLLLDGAGAPHLGTFVFGTAFEDDPPARDGGFEPDPRCDTGRSVVGEQAPAVGAGPGNSAVQGEGHGVEDRCLARARLSVEQKQPVGAEFVEVDLDGAGERAERRDLERVESHAGTSVRARSAAGSASPTPCLRSASRNAWSIHPSSRADGAERTSPRNASAICTSLRPRTLSR